MRPEDWNEVLYFSASEFNHPERMGYEFVLWLDKVRAKAAVKMMLVSDARDEKDKIGAKDSAHNDTPCDSVDIGKRPTEWDKNWNRHRFKIITAALELGCRRIGIYPGGSLHLDRSEGRRPADVLWVMVDNPAA
jgi:hypothetical protein